MRALLPLAILLVAAAPASADEIGWRAPKGCPTAKSLRQRVEKRLAHPLDVAIGVDVEVSRHGGQYTATIDLRGVTVGNDVRTLTSKRCGELADAVAVIVARLAGDAVVKPRAAPDPVTTVAVADDEDPTPSVLEAAPPALPRTAIDWLSPQPKRFRTWALGARVSGVSGIGVIPQVGVGGELAVTLRRHDTLGEIAMTRWLTSVAQFHEGRPAKVDVGLDVASVRAGWRPAKLPLRAWLAVETGTMHGEGVSLPTEQIQAGRWLAAGAGFGVAWQMAPWIRLVGSTETMLAIERVRFATGDGIIVYAPSPMSFRTMCGLEVGWQ